MTVICSKCRVELSITGDWSGQEVVCPKCKRVIGRTEEDLDAGACLDVCRVPMDIQGAEPAVVPPINCRTRTGFGRGRRRASALIVRCANIARRGRV